jgi:hypothetical protein
MAIQTMAGLREYGAPLPRHGVITELVSEPRHCYRMGRTPFLIEVSTRIEGVTLDEAPAGALTGDLEGRLFA